VDTGAHDPAPGDVVELRLPADASYVSIARLTAAGLAARADLTVDDVEDLRLAVDEACSLVLPHANGSGALELRFVVEDGCVTTTVSAAAAADAEVDPAGFPWTVLSALATTVAVRNADGRLEIELTRRRQEARL
jgi:serine/threonine-protein kinase RsbW